MVLVQYRHIQLFFMLVICKSFPKQLKLELAIEARTSTWILSKLILYTYIFSIYVSTKRRFLAFTEVLQQNKEFSFFFVEKSLCTIL